MNIRLVVKKVPIIALISFLISSCQSKIVSYNESFRDFDVFTKKGINKLNEDERTQLITQNRTVFTLVKHDNKLDSIIVINPYGRSPEMRLKVICKASVTLFKTSYPFDGGISYLTYYVLSKGKAMQYTSWGQGQWLVISINSRTSYGGAKVINDVDTVNFESKLLRSDSIKMMKMPGHLLNRYPTKLNKSFTFNSWLHTKNYEVIY